VAAPVFIQRLAEGVDHLWLADERFAAVIHRKNQIANSSGLTDSEAACPAAYAVEFFGSHSAP
jgi:hypothetical protein